MSSVPAGRPGNLVLASLTGILVLAEGGLAALGLLVRNAQQRGNLTSTEAATFVLLGTSAAVGAVVLFLALVALARGPKGHSLARVASGLAWLRLAGVIAALMVIAIQLGVAAVAGMLETFGAAVAVLDALIAVIVTGVAVRRTRHG
jgi:hypothetical protein